jgi:hypothetical protein
MQPLDEQRACISNLEFDEWLAAELDAESALRCERHAAGCARCAERRAQFERDAATFHAQAPRFDPAAIRARQATQAGATPAPVAEPTSRTAARQRASRLPQLSAALAACAALAAALALLLRPVESGPRTRAKGAPHLGFFVKRAEQVARGEDATPLHPNDLIRFVYSADRSYYFALFDLDARTASVYFPSTPGAQQVRPGNDMPLDFSVQLDAQLGTERVIGVFCAEPFEVEAVRSALASAAPLPAAIERCERAELTLHKRAPP